jgi:parallel beta-helix repeat protein
VLRVGDNTIALDELGADKTGAIDVVPILEVAKSKGYKVKQSGGSFLVDSNFTLTDGLDIELTGGAEFVRTNEVSFVAGSASDRTPLVATADYVIGSHIITLDATSYANVSVNDRLYIRNKESDNEDFILDFVADPNTLDNWVYQVQSPKVLMKLGANQIMVSEAAKMDYPLTGAGLIDVMNDTVTNVKIKANFRNNLGAPVTNTESVWMRVSAMYGLDIAGSKFYLNNESGGVFITVGRVDSILDTEFHDGRQLDLFLRQDCPDSKLIGGKFFNHRTNDASIFIEAHNYNITIHSNSFNTAIWDDTTPLLSAIQMDAKVNNCSIMGNQIYGYPCGLRMELGCFENSITSNTFQLCEISGIRMVSTRSNSVVGNTILDCGLSSTADATLSQQQGGIYVNSIEDTTIIGNTLTWVAPTFAGNFFAALSGSMKKSTFEGNTVSQSQRAVWLIDGSSNNSIRNNLKLEAIGTDNAVLINGSNNHYNKVENNLIVGRDTAESTGVVIEAGSEGNSVKHNEMLDVVYAIKLLSTSNYQSIKGNYGDFTRSINASISAPVMPTNATVLREFEIYKVNFDQLGGNGGKWWQYKQNIGTERWAEFSVPETFVDL